MMGRSPQCYIPSFVEIDPSVPEKQNFEGFLPYMGVTSIMSSDFHFLVPESFHTKFGSDRHSSSREEDFQRFLPCIGMAAMLVM